MVSGICVFTNHIACQALSTRSASENFAFLHPQRIIKHDGTSIILWSAEDSLVQKILTLYLQDKLPLHSSCTHIKGHGGHKYAIRQINQCIQSDEYGFVCRTDIRGYYANINKHILIEQLAGHIACPIVLNLLAQFIFYHVEYGGTFHTPINGISRGSPLSPLLAAFHLYEVDVHFAEQQHIKYLRYMDDFIILCKTRHHLRKAVKELNQFLNRYGFEKHPDKTFIGKAGRGFDYLGYHFNRHGLTGLARSTIAHYNDNIRRLYEQAEKKRESEDSLNLRVAEYQRRWERWAKSGLTLPDALTK